jgi:hypothetical protein
MTQQNTKSLFSDERCDQLLPRSRSDEFFEALFGDPAEGSYDIVLRHADSAENQLRFELQLHQRPGHCLVCNLTYGLPEVFSRHPILNINELVGRIGEAAQSTVADWRLGTTSQRSSELHVIPLTIELG